MATVVLDTPARDRAPSSPPASGTGGAALDDPTAHLHESLGNTLLLLERRLVVLLESEATEQGRRELRRLHALASEALENLRLTSDALALLKLRRLPLERALRLLAADVRRRGDSCVDVRVRGPVAAVPPPVRDVLVRAAHDVLVDLRGRARATVVLVTLAFRPGEVVVEVSDDGVDVAQPQHLDWRRRSPELVLAAVARLVRGAGGQLVVLRGRPRGLRIRIRVPLHEADA